MSRYSHTVLADEAKALEVLPQFPTVFDEGPDTERSVLRATGTDCPAGGGGNRGPTGKAVLPLCLPEKEPLSCADVHFCAVNPWTAKNAGHERAVVDPVFVPMEGRVCVGIGG
jgi:hypothetical protein